MTQTTQDGTYTTLFILTPDQLRARMSDYSTLVEQHIWKAAHWSLKHDLAPMYVSTTCTRVCMEPAAPPFNGTHYRVTGHVVEKYKPRLPWAKE